MAPSGNEKERIHDEQQPRVLRDPSSAESEAIDRLQLPRKRFRVEETYETRATRPPDAG